MKKYDLIFITNVTEEYTKRQAFYFFSNGYGISVINMEDKELFLYIQQQEKKEEDGWAEKLIESLNL